MLKLERILLIDRATLAETLIKRGTKLDNLVQIAHNVVIGEDCCLAAQVGIAGSTTLGDRVNIAGHGGAAGHLTLGEDSVVYAKSAVTKDMPAGSHLSGFPARPHKQELRIHAATRRLPELLLNSQNSKTGCGTGSENSRARG